MKLAILVCGEYREFEIAYPSWEFINKTDNDVYFSTWSKSIQKNDGLNFYIEEDITEDKIRKILPNANISIVDNSINVALPNNTHRMHYHWKNALDMLINGGKEYSHVLLIRPDLYYQNVSEKYENYDTQIKPNVLYGTNKITLVNNGTFGVDDTFFLGLFETMKEFISDLPIETEMHSGLSKYIIDKNWYVEELRMGTSIIRGNCREVINLDSTSIGLKSQEWYEAFHRHKNNQNEN